MVDFGLISGSIFWFLFLWKQAFFFMARLLMGPNLLSEYPHTRTNICKEYSCTFIPYHRVMGHLRSFSSSHMSIPLLFCIYTSLSLYVKCCLNQYYNIRFPDSFSYKSMRYGEVGFRPMCLPWYLEGDPVQISDLIHFLFIKINVWWKSNLKVSSAVLLKNIIIKLSFLFLSMDAHF